MTTALMYLLAEISNAKPHLPTYVFANTKSARVAKKRSCCRCGYNMRYGADKVSSRTVLELNQRDRIASRLLLSYERGTAQATQALQGLTLEILLLIPLHEHDGT